MSRVKLLMDSGADLPADLMKRYDITVVPLVITVDGKEYTDYYEMTKERFFEALKTCRDLPKTSQPNPYTFVEYFKRYEEDYDEIFYVGMSSNGSGTYHSACIAVQDYKEHGGKLKITTFDSWNATIGIGYYAHKAGQMLEEGKNTQEIYEELMRQRQNFASYMVPETLEFLKKGGRVNTVTAVVGGLLDIRPIITILEGWGRNYGKVRGAKQCVNKLVALYEEQHANLEVYISHCNNLKLAQEMMDLLRQKYEDICITMTEMGSTLSAHAGPGAVGIHFLRKSLHTM